jgi:hypothetical protein
MQRMSTMRMRRPKQPVLWPKIRAGILYPSSGAPPEFSISYRDLIKEKS